MTDDSLRTLARHLGVPERTLRRAAAEGLVHGRRVSERRYKTTMREESYLREHWPLLRELRGALRTEPNVRLAVLFGSVAVGQETAGSDIDVLVQLRDGSAPAVAALAQRLGDRVGREVQLVRIEDAASSAVLMVDALANGRVLVDRDRSWAQLKASERRWRRRAALEDVPLEDSIPDLGLS
jgi:predicted nucleotidyltransferase